MLAPAQTPTHKKELKHLYSDTQYIIKVKRGSMLLVVEKGLVGSLVNICLAVQQHQL